MPDGVRLRPLRPEDVDVLLSEPDDGGGAPVPEDGERRRKSLLEKVERGGALADGRLDLAVEADGRFAGAVDARQPKGAMPPGVFEIGIDLLRAERQRGIGRRAVELLVERLLGEGGHRIQAATSLENAPMRRVLELLGFRFEGVLRQFMPRADGGRDDYAMYAVTRADWETRADGSP